MKRLLGALFASMVVFSLAMPALASGAKTSTTTTTAKTQKHKATKSHKAHKATVNKTPAKS